VPLHQRYHTVQPRPVLEFYRDLWGFWPETAGVLRVGGVSSGRWHAPGKASIKE
jgi:hypothetical protein